MLTNEELLKKAEEAATFSYSPYSHFRVGAAVECSDGTLYTGCNVENAAYGCAICAERTAMLKGVSEGHKDFARISIYSPDGDTYCSPCGQCRQFMAEFNLDMDLVIGRNDGAFRTFTLRELLPEAFTPENL